ncbi:hypothetical protein ABAC402_18205 [Asticcacaulis sp. AC402]|nr:hypothetical protein ABAC402_18205 [Asticcacaulis sp. AC402]
MGRHTIQIGGEINKNDVALRKGETNYDRSDAAPT